MFLLAYHIVYLPPSESYAKIKPVNTGTSTELTYKLHFWCLLIHDMLLEGTVYK